MTHWYYKATTDRVSRERTEELLIKHGFVCRSAYNERANGTFAFNSHVQDVDFGDVLHMYYVQDGRPTVLGSFEVVGPNRHPHADQFGAAVKATKLVQVAAGSDLLRVLQGMVGYDVDPKLGSFTGWRVVPSVTKTPDYDLTRFPGQHVLVR